MACLTISDELELAQALDHLQRNSGWTVVALDYELGYLFEKKAAPPGWRPGKRLLARFWRFARRIPMMAEAADRWLAEREVSGVAGIGGLRESIDENAYIAAVDRIKTLISAGDCYQVNLTFPLTFEWFGAPLALYRQLRARQPVRYGGFVGDDKAALLSMSPELFIERKGDRLVTRPMKGTAARDLPADTLRSSVKDRAENLMIVDLLRNDLGRVADLGSVKVDRLFEIEDYPTVWQMVSEVSASVGRRDFGEILRALFPCGSITGAPKVRAMQIAAEQERDCRGIYTGALGWLAPDGDFRLNVAIRTLELEPNGVGKLGIGSGIVADSRPLIEWQECRLKSGFLRDCDPGLRLIETLRREEGVYPRLAGHLDRLRRSAEWFGFAYDEEVALQALGEIAEEGVWRVRLTLGKAGNIEVGAVQMPGELPGERLAVLAEARIASDDLLRRHKTTARDLYDQALHALADDPQVFDAIFLNERGEVVEGARSNVFVERDGILLTPPLASGALPGVLRAELLANGRAREAVLTPEDLKGGFWLGNALRGLIAVRLKPAI